MLFILREVSYILIVLMYTSTAQSIYCLHICITENSFSCSIYAEVWGKQLSLKHLEVYCFMTSKLQTTQNWSSNSLQALVTLLSYLKLLFSWVTLTALNQHCLLKSCQSSTFLPDDLSFNLILWKAAGCQLYNLSSIKAIKDVIFLSCNRALLYLILWNFPSLTGNSSSVKNLWKWQRMITSGDTHWMSWLYHQRKKYFSMTTNLAI